jgi:hypothetical protein
VADIYAKLADELDQAQAAAFATQEPVEPTDDERRNGWTAETLAAYQAERNAGAAVKIDPASMHRRLMTRPNEQNTRYDPFRWRE